MGAKLASPESRVFAVVGDGGFAHCWSELECAKRNGINVITIVLNNGILGYQTHGENVTHGAHTDACEFEPVDHAAIARACGCIGERISAPEQIQDALERACSASVPVLLDVVTDPEAFVPLTFFAGKNPLEIPLAKELV
jgi:acetolactate synthase-1/2/3 large subunit